MNFDSACASEKKSFRTEKFSFEAIPNQSKIFLDFQANSAKSRKYYPEKLSTDFIKKVLDEYKTDRNSLCEILTEINKSFAATDQTFQNIELLRAKDCVAVVTGQQAGLFTGALYTIYKILSAIRLAENLRNRGVKAVPIFWIAEEDHDFDEVKKTFVLDRSGEIAEIENSPANFAENSPVGLIALDDTIEETKKSLFGDLRETIFTGELKKLLDESYKSGETYSTSFAKMLSKLFGKHGLIILSPLDERLKKLSAPIFAEIVKKSGEIRSALLEKSARLEADGYHSQVLVEKDFFPFFLLENNIRLPVKKNASGNFQVKNTKREFSLEELINLAQNEPQKLSPNALTRSIVQDYLLPTAAYFGGAAEIAYFAQNAAIYEILERPRTPVKHRASFTIIEPRNRRTLEKYELELTDLFAGKEEISARIVNKFLASETAEKFADAEKNIGAHLDALSENLERFDVTLAVNLENRRRKISYHINALLKKFQRSKIQKNEIVRRRIEFLYASLLPHKALQERSLNITYFLDLYGENFLDWIYDAVDEDEIGHQIFYL